MVYKQTNIPLITIATVVFNGEATLEKTICSVKKQLYKNFEYLIIDGGSIDGTVNIIKKYNDTIKYWISESDTGIYHAMNKAINLANGEWIMFINSGDCLTENILEIVSPELNESNDIVYSDVLIEKNSTLQLEKAKLISNIYFSLPFCHQSTIIKTSICKKSGFSLKYKICSDYHFFYNCYKSGYSFNYFNKPICTYLYGGASNNNSLYYKEMISIIWGSNKGFLRLYYIYRLSKSFIPFNRHILSSFIRTKLQINNS